MDVINYSIFTWFALIAMVGGKATIDGIRFQNRYRKVTKNPRFPILAGETAMFPRSKSGLVDPFGIIYTQRSMKALWSTHKDSELNRLAKMARREFIWGMALMPIGFCIIALLIIGLRPSN